MKRKIDFQDGCGHLAWILDQNYVSDFYLRSLSCFKSIGLLVLEKKLKTDFQDGHGHLGFWIGMMLAISVEHLTSVTGVLGSSPALVDIFSLHVYWCQK